jgi:hypothetical protein
MSMSIFMLMQGEQEHDHEHDQEHDHELDQEHDHEHDQEHDHEHDQKHEHKQEIYLRDKFFISVIGLFDFESVRHRNRLEFRHILYYKSMSDKLFSGIGLTCRISNVARHNFKCLCLPMLLFTHFLSLALTQYPKKLFI